MITRFENENDWKAWRLSKITGTRLGKIVSKVGLTKEAIVAELEREKIEFKKSAPKEELQKLLSPKTVTTLERALPKKLEFYAMLAERLASPPDNEDEMVRGKRLESVSIAEFSKVTGKIVDGSLIGISRDDNPNIAISPDGIISETEMVESKSLSSARHIEAYLTQTIPEEYHFQVLQYFITSDKLETLYFLFYDDRVMCKPFFYLSVQRSSLQEEITKYLEYQKNVLAEVEELVAKLSNF